MDNQRPKTKTLLGNPKLFLTILFYSAFLILSLFTQGWSWVDIYTGQDSGLFGNSIGYTTINGIKVQLPVSTVITLPSQSSKGHEINPNANNKISVDLTTGGSFFMSSVSGKTTTMFYTGIGGDVGVRFSLFKFDIDPSMLLGIDYNYIWNDKEKKTNSVGFMLSPKLDILYNITPLFKIGLQTGYCFNAYNGYSVSHFYAGLILDIQLIKSVETVKTKTRYHGIQKLRIDRIKKSKKQEHPKITIYLDNKILTNNSEIDYGTVYVTTNKNIITNKIYLTNIHTNTIIKTNSITNITLTNSTNLNNTNSLSNVTKNTETSNTNALNKSISPEENKGWETITPTTNSSKSDADTDIFSDNSPHVVQTMQSNTDNTGNTGNTNKLFETSLSIVTNLTQSNIIVTNNSFLKTNIVISNASTTPLSIKGYSIEGNSFSVKTKNDFVSIKPKQMKTLTVYLNRNRPSKNEKAKLTIISDDPNKRRFVVFINGNVLNVPINLSNQTIVETNTNMEVVLPLTDSNQTIVETNTNMEVVPPLTDSNQTIAETNTNMEVVPPLTDSNQTIVETNTN